MKISSSYAKILGEKLFRTWEFPRSGSKAKNGEEKNKERKRERLNDGNNNGQATHGARKHAWPTQATWANMSELENNIFKNINLSFISLTCCCSTHTYISDNIEVH